MTAGAVIYGHIQTKAANEQNARQVDAQVDALRAELAELPARIAERQASIEQARASAELAKGQLEDLRDPTRRARDLAALEQARREQMMAASELLEVIGPQIEFVQGQETWRASRIDKSITIKNSGKRTVVATISTSARLSNSAGAPSQALASRACQGGVISPGQSLYCAMIVTTDGSFENVHSIDIDYVVKAKTLLRDSDPVKATIMRSFSKRDLDGTIERTFSIKGEMIN